MSFAVVQIISTSQQIMTLTSLPVPEYIWILRIQELCEFCIRHHSVAKPLCTELFTSMGQGINGCCSIIVPFYGLPFCLCFLLFLAPHQIAMWRKEIREMKRPSLLPHWPVLPALLWHELFPSQACFPSSASFIEVPKALQTSGTTIVMYCLISCPRWKQKAVHLSLVAVYDSVWGRGALWADWI